ncbi:MAG TPA: uracil-DNA glycosylase family protein [Roseiarcus sp.]|nr:uracil-DNA glycosylase family protein [Roseiarcus sp.]
MPAPFNKLLREIRACRVCRDAPRSGRPLPHEPRPIIQASIEARLCIAGQAPGVRVNASGRPYDDPSGVRLRQWLGIDEATFYDPKKIAVVPMGFCFPGLDAKGGDLPPRKECAATWRRRIFDALPRIELILLVGLYAQKWHLGAAATAEGLSGTVGKWRDIYRPKDQRRLLPLPHPSWRNNVWLKRNPWFEAELLPVLRGEVSRLTA